MNLDSICLNVSIGVLFVDDHQKIIKVNSYLIDKLGYKETELIGTLASKLIIQKNISVAQTKFNFSKSYAGITMESDIDLVALGKNGKEYPVEITLDYIESENGNYLIAFVNDITKRRSDENALKKLNKDLENLMIERTTLMSQTVKEMAKLMSETEIKDRELLKVNSFLNNVWNFAQIIFIVTDENGIIKMFNHNAEIQLGHHAEDVVNKISLFNFFDSKDYRKRHQQLKAELNNDLKFGFESLVAKSDLDFENDFESIFVRKDGSTFPVMVTLNKIDDHGQKQGYICVCRNISIRRKAEKEIQNALEKEKELSELQGEFLSLASHELRTPLSVVLSSANIISIYLAKNEYSKIDKHTERIISSVNTLKGILDDFLSMSKIKEGKIEVVNANEDIKLNIEKNISELGTLLKPNQKVIYHHEGDSHYFIDANMLKYIIVNLISNAIKFSPEGSQIKINTQIKQNQFLFMIKDKGCGVSQEDQQLLFKRYFRGSNVTAIPGTGLGLHIVKQYVERMNGTIKFRSKLENGTIIKILFEKVPIQN
jgi:PAS domain S-box-containing protein